MLLVAIILPIQNDTNSLNMTDMTGNGHIELFKVTIVTTFNPQEHAKTPILSCTPEYHILPNLNIPLFCGHFHYTRCAAASGNLYD